jgi:predicted Zn finger-like uncharacterized protein
MWPTLAHHWPDILLPEPSQPMQIVCPACAATYEVPMTLLRPGQSVRCARCAGEWVPSPATPQMPIDARPEAMSDTAPAPELGAANTRPARRPPAGQPIAPRPNLTLRFAWAASIIVVLLLGWAAYAERSLIMQIWPPSIRLFAALGLHAEH